MLKSGGKWIPLTPLKTLKYIFFDKTFRKMFIHNNGKILAVGIKHMQAWKPGLQHHMGLNAHNSGFVACEQQKAQTSLRIRAV